MAATGAPDQDHRATIDRRRAWFRPGALLRAGTAAGALRFAAGWNSVDKQFVAGAGPTGQALIAVQHVEPAATPVRHEHRLY
jgi:hypothetical protein